MNIIIDNWRTLGSTSSTEYIDIESANKLNESLHNDDMNFYIGMNQSNPENSSILYNNCKKFITPFNSKNIIWNHCYQLFMLMLIIIGFSFFVVYIIIKFWMN